MRLIKTALLALALFLAACDTNHRLFRDGVDGNRGDVGQAGSSCHVTQTPTGANINCDDGSTATVANGLTGASGSDGSSCSVIPTVDNSGALITCQDGSSVFVSNGTNGSNGVDGQPGAIGPAGPQGNPGVNATSVEFVKFCPGSTPSYGNFPEYGIKTNSKVYAVYSANNGFLTLLSPGGYTTASTGLNCNFTVNADGSLSY